MRALAGRIALTGIALVTVSACGRSGFEPRPAREAAATNVSYYGGPVLSQVEVVDVYWGANVDPQVTAWAGPFFSAVTASPYYDYLQEYSTDVAAAGGGSGTNQMLYRGSWLKDVTITPSVSGTTVDDTQVTAELAAQINAGTLPPPNGNTLYMTFFPSGTTITQGGVNACTYCAYHSSFAFGSGRIAYGVMPYMGDSCAAQCGPGDLIGNNENTASHELIEATTDPQIVISSTAPLGPPDGWIANDANGDEIGDLCIGQYGTANGHLVQKGWSNKLGACVDNNPAVTPLPIPSATPTPAGTPPATPTPTDTPEPSGNGATVGAKGCGCDLNPEEPAWLPILVASTTLLTLSRRRRS